MLFVLKYTPSQRNTLLYFCCYERYHTLFKQLSVHNSNDNTLRGHVTWRKLQSSVGICRITCESMRNSINTMMGHLAVDHYCFYVILSDSQITVKWFSVILQLFSNDSQAIFRTTSCEKRSDHCNHPLRTTHVHVPDLHMGNLVHWIFGA